MTNPLMLVLLRQDLSQKILFGTAKRTDSRQALLIGLLHRPDVLLLVSVRMVSFNARFLSPFPRFRHSLYKLALQELLHTRPMPVDQVINGRI